MRAKAILFSKVNEIELGEINVPEPDCLERLEPQLLSWNGGDRLGRQEVYSLLLVEIADRMHSAQNQTDFRQ